MNELAERFWSRVDRRGPDECWPWVRGRVAFGYGRLAYRGVQYNSHRLAWELTYGPIPAGAWVLHRCDNAPCCNPAHLYLGDHGANTRDAVERGRVATGDRNGARLYPERLLRGERDPKAKLTEAKVREIRALSAAGASDWQLAKRFGVRPYAITNVVQRRSWKHVA